MTPEESLKQGDPKAALKSLQDQVRQQPANAEYRVFLFQLLCVLGQWDKALTQLNVAGELDSAALAMVSMYREVLSCEVFREQVFQDNKTPVFFGDPQEWAALLVQALRHIAQGQCAESKQHRDRAYEVIVPTSGKINGEAFQWVADADSRLGPLLEVIMDGRYFWVPFEHIKAIDIEEPQDLRDMVWLPCHLIWQNGGESYGVIPTRYPMSYEHDDPLVGLSRKTQWGECGADTYLGVGQRMLVTDVGEYPLLNIRTLEFDSLSHVGTMPQSGSQNG